MVDPLSNAHVSGLLLGVDDNAATSDSSIEFVVVDVRFDTDVPRSSGSVPGSNMHLSIACAVGTYTLGTERGRDVLVDPQKTI